MVNDLNFEISVQLEAIVDIHILNQPSSPGRKKLLSPTHTNTHTHTSQQSVVHDALTIEYSGLYRHS